MAGGHIFEDFVGIPRAFDNEVAVVVEPFDEALGVLAVGFGNVGVLESFDGHECQPGVGILFHKRGVFFM